MPEVKEDNFEAADFPEASGSFDNWLFDATVSDPYRLFFPRFKPAVVETFQTSFTFMKQDGGMREQMEQKILQKLDA